MMHSRRLALLAAAVIFSACGSSEKARIANPNTSYLPGGGPSAGPPLLVLRLGSLDAELPGTSERE